VNLKNLLYFTLILIIGFACRTNHATNVSLDKFEFQDTGSASKMITKDTIENFFAIIRPLDIALQLQSENNSKKAYRKNLKKEVIKFSQKDKNKISPILFEVENKLERINSNYKLPQLNLIQSKGKIYGPNTFYTRENSIIIPQAEIENLTENDFSDIILHEVFHILSRYNPELKKKLYAVIGFNPLTAPLIIEENFNKRILLNPDGINFNYEMSIKTKEESYNVVPIIYSKTDSPTTINSYFENLQFDLFPIRAKEGNWYLSNPEEAASLDLKSHQNFYAQIGRNTKYIIHPDEILADNFILMINDQNGSGKRGNDILAKMKSILLN
jgi:hypothetical protein